MVVKPSDMQNRHIGVVTKAKVGEDPTESEKFKLSFVSESPEVTECLLAITKAEREHQQFFYEIKLASKIQSRNATNCKQQII